MTLWRTIVIGSGIGSLVAAAVLAHQGKCVPVLQQHTRPGGQTRTFTRQGWHFLAGMHHIGDAGPQPGPQGVFGSLPPRLAWAMWPWCDAEVQRMSRRSLQQALAGIDDPAAVRRACVAPYLGFEGDVAAAGASAAYVWLCESQDIGRAWQNPADEDAPGAFVRSLRCRTRSMPAAPPARCWCFAAPA